MVDHFIPTGGIISGKEDFMFHFRLTQAGVIELYVEIEDKAYGMMLDTEAVSKLDGMIAERYRRFMN